MVLYRGQSALYLNQSSVDSRGIAWYNIDLLSTYQVTLNNDGTASLQ